MKLLLDQDVYAITARFLVELGHDVVTAADIGGSRASDVDLLRAAHDQDRVFVTGDKGGLPRRRAWEPACTMREVVLYWTLSADRVGGGK